MTRPWYRSKRLRIAGVVLVLVLVAAAVVPFLVPADRFRPLLVRFIEGYTGRRVQIDVLRLHLLPTVHLQAVNIRVGNPEGLPAGDMMVVQSVDLGISPKALLSRSLVVTYVAVRGVRLTLLRDLAGRTNYDLVPPAPGSSGAAPEGGGAYFLSLDRISAVTIRNVEVAFSNYDQRRRQATPLFTFSGLNARTQNIRLDTPDWTKSLELISDLRGATFSTPMLTRPIQIQKGMFTITGGTGRGTVAAALEGMHADGVVTVARLDPLSITFTATVPQLDLDLLNKLIVINSVEGPDVQAAPPQHRLLARGEVKVGKILFAPRLAADSMNGRLSVYTNTVQLDSYALSFYEGTVQGAATLDYAASGLPAVATVKAGGINLTQLARTTAPRGAQRVTGTLEADLRLATAFGRDPKAALTGVGTFAVRNGTLKGLDLKSTLAKMARVLQPNVPGGATSFSYLGGDLRIAKQRVYSDAIRFDAEGLEVQAAGSFGFNTRLDYAGTGVLKKMTSETSPSGGVVQSAGRMLGGVLRGAAVATRYRVPFFVRGTFDDPQFSQSSTPQLPRDQIPKQPKQRFPQEDR